VAEKMGTLLGPGASLQRGLPSQASIRKKILLASGLAGGALSKRMIARVAASGKMFLFAPIDTLG